MFPPVAGLAMVLAAYIVVKTNISGYTTEDAGWVRACRNAGFFIMLMMLGYAIWDDGSKSSLEGLFYSGVLALTMNVLALHFRK